MAYFKQTYELVARVLRNAHEYAHGPSQMKLLDDIAFGFAKEFEAVNDTFDWERFIAATKPSRSNHEMPNM